MWSASTAASSPTPDRNEEFSFDSHCRPRKYRPGTDVMPLLWTASPLASMTGTIDPAEIDAVAGGPDHRSDAFRSEVEPLQRCGDAGRVGKGCSRAGFFGQLQAAAFYILVHDIEEGGEGEVAVGEAIGKAGCDLDDAVLGCLEMSDQDHAVGGEVAEIDGAAAIGA